MQHSQTDACRYPRLGAHSSGRLGADTDPTVLWSWRAPGPQGPVRLELDLLRDAESILDLDPEVPNGALQLRMAEQELDGSQVPGFLIDLRRLGSSHRMRAICRRFEASAVYPTVNEAGVLPR